MPDTPEPSDEASAPAMPKSSPAAVARFKAMLPDDPRISTRPMFGNLAAFTNGYLFAGLFGDSVFVRLDEAGLARLNDQGGRPFEPMPGRPMRGYGFLPEASARDNAAGRAYLEQSLAHTLALPPKAPKVPVRKRQPTG